MKGISPLIASVLLIAITMAIAAIVASWTTSFTRESLPSSACVGGSIAVISTEYPKWTGSAITAVVESKYATLEDFRFAVLMKDDTVNIYDNAGPDTHLEPGQIGTIATGSLAIAPTQVRSVQILTSCSEVKTELLPLNT